MHFMCEAWNFYLRTLDTYKVAVDEELKTIVERIQIRSLTTLYEALMGRVVCYVVQRQARYSDLCDLQIQFCDEAPENVHMVNTFHPVLFAAIDSDINYVPPKKVAKKEDAAAAAGAADMVIGHCG